jgi:hypothetical protein
MLTALPRTTLVAIANLATDVLRSGECPESWRDSTVVPLLKPGKRVDELRSYRPVSLSSDVEIQKWAMEGLPMDSQSIENLRRAVENTPEAVAMDFEHRVEEPRGVERIPALLQHR